MGFIVVHSWTGYLAGQGGSPDQLDIAPVQLTSSLATPSERAMGDERFFTHIRRDKMVEDAIYDRGRKWSHPVHPMVLEVSLSSHQAKTSGRVES